MQPEAGGNCRSASWRSRSRWGAALAALQSGQLQPAPTRDSELAGIVVGALLMICSLEFVGAFEQEGWKLAGVLTPIAYVAWSLWLIVVGVTLFL